MSISRHLVLGLASLSVLALFGCSSAAGTDPSEGEATGRSGRDAIIGGTTASGYPEAVLVDMYQNGQLAAYCSGSLIAPQVVLTAGHCVVQFNSWKITAPFAGKQKANASSGATYDYNSTQEYVDANAHDVALIFLDTPISLSSYPKIATSQAADGSKIVNIGRILNGSVSTTSLFVSSAISISGASNYGFPYDYVATDKIESGDSGGPDILSGTHTIVAVNSGAGGGTEVLARVDLVASWISDQIAQHGGSGSSSGGSTSGGSTGTGGSTSGGSTSGGSTSGGSTGSTCAHSLCTTGGTLTASCDPCASLVCQYDSYCCGTAWDQYCVAEAQQWCGKTCPLVSSFLPDRSIRTLVGKKDGGPDLPRGRRRLSSASVHS